VHVKRPKKAYNQNVWKPRPNQKAKHRKRKANKDTENKHERQEEGEVVIVTRLGLVTGIPKIEDHNQKHEDRARISERHA
jgi:hypothetical protein